MLRKNLSWDPSRQWHSTLSVNHLLIISTHLRKKVGTYAVLSLHFYQQLQIISLQTLIWGFSKTTNKRNIQAFQNTCCRIISGALWYISNNAINSDLQICYVNELLPYILQTLPCKTSIQPQPAHQRSCHTMK